MGRIVFERPKPTGKRLEVDNLGSRLAIHIGQQLLALRQKHQVTMRTVAEGTGLSNAFVCQLENGQSLASAETLWKLSAYFEVPVGYWFEGFGIQAATRRKEREG